MEKYHRKTQKSQAHPQELAVLTFVENMEQARNYETLLKTNDIPAMIREQHEQSEHSKSIAIIVPEEFVDEAHVVIESQDAYDDFYDITLGDEDSDDFDSDFFDDEF